VGVGVKVGGIVGWLCCIATIAAFVAATFGVSGYYVLGAAAGWIVSWGVSGYFRSKRGRRSAVKASERRLREAIEKWESEGSKLGAMFDGVVVSLKRRKDEHMRLPAEHAAERTALEKSREVAQREAWLESRFIEGARISGIGPGLKATLASYGVETAADVSLKAMQGIQGFGPTRITTLLGWRADVERAFRFDSNRGVEPAAIRALEVKYAQKRRAIETELSQGKNRLVQVVNSAAEMRRNAEAELSAVTGLLALARADAAELW
jgi:DNA-binding helix-hairpin-helix protein with protein kinase domain